MNTNRTVALVGRPNVGKSRLFNRLTGRRIAIVHDQAGVTRDVNSYEIRTPQGPWTLLDTGGIGLEDANTPKLLIDAAEQQVFVAVETAALICLVVDSKEGLTTLDELIADRLRKSGKQVLLVVNKIDDEMQQARAADFSRLGLGAGVCISAEHGYNADELREKIVEMLPPCEDYEIEAEEIHRTRICFLGRPNVGKSSLCNALLKSERMVVSEVPGTTRDTVELNLDYTDRRGNLIPFRLVDTAGMRKKRQVDSPVEYFSSVRSQDAIARSDVVFVVLDAMDGVTKQEQNLLGQALSMAPSVAVLVNKWDYAVEAMKEGRLHQYETERDYREAFEKSVREALFFLPDSPIMFVSAKTGLFIENILALAASLNRRMDQKLSTGAINRLIAKLFERRAPSRKDGKRFKAYYALQTSNRPFYIRIFCNNAEKLDDSYRRYLERGFIKEFDLQGCPLRFTLVGKPARYRNKD